QSGVVGPAERPHGFTRFESVSIANPGLSDTRFTWWNPAACAAAGAASADVTRIVPTTAANRSRLGDLRASMWPPPSGAPRAGRAVDWRGVRASRRTGLYATSHFRGLLHFGDACLGCVGRGGARRATAGAGAGRAGCDCPVDCRALPARAD